MPYTGPLRSVSALVVTTALVAVLSLSAGPAVAADAPWSAPVEITDSYGDANATVVAPDGTITVVSETPSGIVTSSSTDAGLTWGPSVLAGSGGDYAVRPAVGVTSSGLLAAAWVESLNAVRTIRVAISADKGATWSTPQTLPAVSSDVDDPVVASVSASAYTIAWNEGPDKYSTISVDGGATWSAPQVITQNMNSSNNADLVPVGGGAIVVLFQEFDGQTGRRSIQSERSTDGGATWGPKVIVGTDWSGSFGQSFYTYGVSPADGTLVAVWSRGTGNGDALFATTSTDGGATWAQQFGVSPEVDKLRYFTVKAVSTTAVGILWHYATLDNAILSYSTATVGASDVSAPVTIATSPTLAFDRLPAFSTLGDVRVASWGEFTRNSPTSGFRTSVSCDAGATWSTPAVLAIGQIARTDAQTSVSRGIFAAYWHQRTAGPSGESLYASTLSGACGHVIPALAATGAPLAPTGILALVIVALGAGLVVLRRRSAV